jgi:DNA polymerase-3 subunit epsilon
MDFIALDFETANPNRGSICSIGLAVVKNGIIRKSKHIYVRPNPDWYHGYHTSIHGITHEHTRNQPTFRAVWKELRPYFENQVIVAHNAAFDMSVLRKALDESNLRYPTLEYHCTYRIVKETLPLESHRLNVVAKHLRIPLKHHDAESDARASAEVAIRMMKMFHVNSMEELAVILGFKVGVLQGGPNQHSAYSRH